MTHNFLLDQFDICVTVTPLSAVWRQLPRSVAQIAQHLTAAQVALK
jgi:hypothetical protein